MRVRVDEWMVGLDERIDRRIEIQLRKMMCTTRLKAELPSQKLRAALGLQKLQVNSEWVRQELEAVGVDGLLVWNNDEITAWLTRRMNEYNPVASLACSSWARTAA